MEERTRLAYDSDLTDAQWDLISAAKPAAKGGKTGRPPKYPRREIWNAIFYQARTGCEWRYLPHDLPRWDVVWEHFSRWREDGTLEAVHTALREKARIQAGHEPTPSAAIVDSQTVKAVQKGGSSPRPRKIADTMPASESRDASVTLRWIRWVSSWLSSCTAPPSRIATERNLSSYA
jgi:transposase